MASYSPSRTVLGGSVRILDDGVMAFGSALATASQVEPDTTQTPDGTVLWLSTTWGRNLILADLAAKGDDYALAASTHPTVAIFSATRASVSTTQYVFIQHNATDGIIRTGTGAILLQPNGDTSDYFSFETLTNIPTIKGVGSYVRIGDAVTSGIFASTEDDLAVTGVFEVANTTPAVYISETDQVDPAGRYRLGAVGDIFVIEREQAAAFANALGSATNFIFLQYDRTNTIYGLDAYEGNAWYIRILAGAAATAQTNSRISVGGSTAALTGVRIATGDGAAGLIERIAVLMGAATVDIDISAAALDLNGNVLKGLATVRGNGDANVNFIANKAATDATARNIGFYLLDPATDTETLLVQMTANALTPTIDLQDDLLLRIGTTGDTGIANISAGLAANTASAGTLEGVPVTPVAIAANSFVLGNITNDGDIVLAVSKAGTSHMAFMADGSTGDTIVQASTGQSVDIYIAGTKEYDFAAGTITPTTTTQALFNTVATTINFGGAATTLTVGAAASSATWTGQAWTLTGANSTNNTALTVTNTSNAAAASHSYADISVGGTTSTGDPHVRLTIPGGTSWHMGVDNSDSDNLKIGTGVAVGTNTMLSLDTAGSLSFLGASPYIYVGAASSGAEGLLRLYSAGVARSMMFDISVGAGGAANNVLNHSFAIGGAQEAGLLTETAGGASYTQAKTVWKVPYRDSGLNVAAPTAPTTAVTWLGGLRVEAGDDTNRIYLYANEAWHYINQTAGLSITAEERYSSELGRNWQIGDLGIVRMHKAYGDGGADFLPYPLEEGLRETLLKLLDSDAEFRQQVKEKLYA